MFSPACLTLGWEVEIDGIVWLQYSYDDSVDKLEMAMHLVGFKCGGAGRVDMDAFVAWMPDFDTLVARGAGPKYYAINHRLVHIEALELARRYEAAIAATELDAERVPFCDASRVENLITDLHLGRA